MTPVTPDATILENEKTLGPGPGFPGRARERQKKGGKEGEAERTELAADGFFAVVIEMLFEFVCR